MTLSLSARGEEKRLISELLKIRVAAGLPVCFEVPSTGFWVTALLGNLQSNLFLVCWMLLLSLPAYCRLGQVHLRASQEQHCVCDWQSVISYLSNLSALIVLPQPLPPGTDSGGRYGGETGFFLAFRWDLLLRPQECCFKFSQVAQAPGVLGISLGPPASLSDSVS